MVYSGNSVLRRCSSSELGLSPQCKQTIRSPWSPASDWSLRPIAGLSLVTLTHTAQCRADSQWSCWRQLLRPRSSLRLRPGLWRITGNCSDRSQVSSQHRRRISVNCATMTLWIEYTKHPAYTTIIMNDSENFWFRENLWRCHGIPNKFHPTNYKAECAK